MYMFICPVHVYIVCVISTLHYTTQQGEQNISCHYDSLAPVTALQNEMTTDEVSLVWSSGYLQILYSSMHWYNTGNTCVHITCNCGRVVPCVYTLASYTVSIVYGPAALY